MEDSLKDNSQRKNTERGIYFVTFFLLKYFESTFVFPFSCVE